MKILHTEASCGWGGQEIRILEETLGLIARGHEISIACPHESRIFEEGSKRRIPTHALPIERKNLKGIFALRYWIKKNRPDVINTHSSTDTWLTALACKTLRNPPPIVRTRHISSSIPNNWASRWLYTQAVSYVVTTGEALRQQIIAQTGASPDRVTSIPTGIDPERFKPGDKREARTKLGLDPDSNYIGIVATLRSWKGHLYLLEAFAQLNAPEWRLLIVGDGPYREVLEKNAEKLQINTKTIFAGQQNNPEAWLQAMDIFCLPSYANEGVPQAILQAMLTKLPIITTKIGAIGEAITNRSTGIIVADKDSFALNQALNTLMQDAGLAHHLASQAFDAARTRFSLERLLDNMESTFRACLRY